MDTKKNPSKSTAKIKVTENGPYIVTGSILLSEQIIGTDEDGFSAVWCSGKEYPLQESYSLCRCGKSKNKPYCDGSHITTWFNGRETASHEPYSKLANRIDGPDLRLMDAPDLCAFARFCDRGESVWSYTRDSNDPEAKKIAIAQARNCPSGRLVTLEKKTNQVYDEGIEKSIVVVEDPQMGCPGPIWVRGGIPIEDANGKPYEIRNRVTLCRCGKSGNKPLCDGSHAR
ncbi:MAG: CDGSH iron-sulfur domain-containing protein [Candidatus Bathyarchaeia archaeon]|jgi:CDGSH-type Zn-finger protein